MSNPRERHGRLCLCLREPPSADSVDPPLSWLAFLCRGHTELWQGWGSHFPSLHRAAAGPAAGRCWDSRWPYAIRRAALARLHQSPATVQRVIGLVLLYMLFRGPAPSATEISFPAGDGVARSDRLPRHRHHGPRRLHSNRSPRLEKPASGLPAEGRCGLCLVPLRPVGGGDRRPQPTSPRGLPMMVGGNIRTHPQLPPHRPPPGGGPPPPP